MFSHVLRFSNLPIAGRLIYFLPAWVQIARDPWVLQVVQGYQIQFVCDPIQEHLPVSGHTSQANQALIDQEVQELLAKQAVQYVPFSRQNERGFVISLFVVPKKGEGHRPVINLRPLIKQLYSIRTFQNGIDSHAEDLFKQKDYLSKDLSNKKFKPSRKPNDDPLYINRHSNHPPSIIKQLPTSNNKRISALSADEQTFHESAPIYQNALNKAQQFRPQTRLHETSTTKNTQKQTTQYHLV